MQHTQSVSRRDVVRSLGLMAAGLVASACAPLRILTHAYPDEFKHHPDVVDRALRAFVATVIPGADPEAADLTRAFRDPRYPFAPYAEFFAADLARRAHDRFGEHGFAQLTLHQRTAVIRDGLKADETTRKLYQGAIYLAQISFYGGIYDDDAGCPLIDFPGRFRGDPVTYADAHKFLPRAQTLGGNHA